MTGPIALIAALVLMSATPVLKQEPRGVQARAARAAPAQATIDGEWTVYIGRKSSMFKGALNQTGTKLSGYMGDETAEYPVTGTIDGGDVKFVFSIYEGGDTVKITITGKFERGAITATAKMDNLDVEVSVLRSAR